MDTGTLLFAAAEGFDVAYFRQFKHTQELNFTKVLVTKEPQSFSCSKIFYQILNLWQAGSQS